MAKTSTGVPGPGGPHLPTGRQARTYSLQSAYISVSANLKLKDIYMLNLANMMHHQQNLYIFIIFVTKTLKTQQLYPYSLFRPFIFFIYSFIRIFISKTFITILITLCLTRKLTCGVDQVTAIITRAAVVVVELKQ